MGKGGAYTGAVCVMIEQKRKIVIACRTGFPVRTRPKQIDDLDGRLFRDDLFKIRHSQEVCLNHLQSDPYHVNTLRRCLSDRRQRHYTHELHNRTSTRGEREKS